MTSQLSLPERQAHRNHFLFSDYYLNDILRKRVEWNEAVAAADSFLPWLQSLYGVVHDQLPSFNESQLEKNWIQPILEKLGHVYEVQPSIPAPQSQLYKPDYIFFADDGSRLQANPRQNTAEYAQAALAAGEVKRWLVNLSKKSGSSPAFDDNNPMYQIDAYLRATDLDWGILTNGRFWRLVHRDSSYKLESYFEIDLLDALENDRESGAKGAAAFFWLLFRQAAFVPDGQGSRFLDRTLKASRDFALALENDLRDNAYRSLEQLIVGFFTANGSRLDPESETDRRIVYTNSLYLLYRLLFLFFGESRALLPMHNPAYNRDYSLQALAKGIDSRRNTMSDLPASGRSYWNRLAELFRLISGSDPRLNADLDVPRYNGGLFDPDRHPFLEKYGVGDRYLAQAIDYLAYRRESENGAFMGFKAVDYRTLGVRQLGSIYEGLLEYKIAVAEEALVVVRKSGVDRWVPAAERGRSATLDSRQPGELYLATDKGERKATGSYYTPDYIVKYITEQTLTPLVEAARERVAERVKAADITTKAGQQQQGAAWFIEAILALNVLDPAMGSGHFLVEANSFLARALATDPFVTIPASGQKPGFSTSQFQDNPTGQKPGFSTSEAEADLTYWKRRVVEACIYGVDKNEMAVELGKLSLWLETVAADKPLSFLDHHLRHGDSLVGARLDDLQSAPGTKRGQSRVEGQQGLFDESAFTQDVFRAVGGIMAIEGQPSDDIEVIYAKERAWKDIRETHLARWRTLADLWTSSYFGNEMTPEEYRALADQLQGRQTMMTPSQQAQFLSHPALVENDYFHWELEFPEVFFDEYGRSLSNKIGFNGIIGNPPYLDVSSNLDSGTIDFIKYSFPETFTGNSDILYYFLALIDRLSVEEGYLGMIVARYFQEARYSQKLRAFLCSTATILEVVDFRNFQVFGETVNVLTTILLLQKSLVNQDKLIVKRLVDDKINENEIATAFSSKSNIAPFETFLSKHPVGSESWQFLRTEVVAISEKLQLSTLPLGRLATVVQSMQTGRNEILSPPITVLNEYGIEKELIHPIAKAGSILRYEFKELQNAIIWTEGVDINNYPNTKKYLSQFKDDLETRYDIKSRHANWWEISNPRNAGHFFSSKPRILVPFIATGNKFCVDTGKKLLNDGGDIRAIFLDQDSSYSEYYICALLNTNLYEYYHLRHTKLKRGGYYEYFEGQLSALPIYKINFSTLADLRKKYQLEAIKLYTRFCEKDDFDGVFGFVNNHLSQEPQQSDVVHDLLAFLAEQMITMNKEKQELTETFWLDLEGVVGDEKDFETLRNKGKWEQSLAKSPALRPYVNAESRSTRGLDESLGWDEAAFKAFLKMLVKTVPNLSDLVAIYRRHAPAYQTLTQRLTQTDGLIDQIVYRLYGLTEEEIGIVEGEARL